MYTAQICRVVGCEWLPAINTKVNGCGVSHFVCVSASDTGKYVCLVRIQAVEQQQTVKFVDVLQIDPDIANIVDNIGTRENKSGNFGLG